MNVKVEKTDKNMVTLEIEVDKERFEEGMEHSYRKNVKHILVSGFRKGKAPRRFVEKYYGEGIFYEDAINFVCPDAYDDAVKENDLVPVAQPELDIVQIGEGKPLIFKATVAVKPEFELGEYKGIKVDKIEYIPTDEDVTAELTRMLEQNARIVTVEDRPVATDDIAVIDYEGFVDDVAFEGGKGEDHELTIGSGQFIPGFEEQLIGKTAGEACDVKVTFPEEYHAEELKGKDAIFKVTVKAIKKKELPAADDEFAKDVSEFDTLDELKADIKKKQTEAGVNRAQRETEDKILETIAEATEIDIPQPMVETQIDRMMDDFGYRLSSQGMTLEQYAGYMGSTVEGMRGQFADNAKKAVKTNLIIEKIAQLEKIEATEEEVEAEFQKMADMYKMEIDKIKSIMGENADGVKADLRTNKTLTFLVENADIKKARKKAAPKTTDTEAAEEPAAEKPKKAPAKKTAKPADDDAKKPAAKKTTAKKPAAKKDTAKTE